MKRCTFPHCSCEIHCDDATSRKAYAICAAKGWNSDDLFWWTAAVREARKQLCAEVDNRRLCVENDTERSHPVEANERSQAA